MTRIGRIGADLGVDIGTRMTRIGRIGADFGSRYWNADEADEADWRGQDTGQDTGPAIHSINQAEGL